MSIEKIASDARVGKSTIYRRYPSKEVLAVAAIATLKDDLGPPPDTGSAFTDIVEMLVQHRAILTNGPGFGMIGALLIEERRNPEFLELFRQRIIWPRRDDMMTVLQRGVDRGEIRADVDLDVVVDALVGSILAGYLAAVTGSRERIEMTVDTIWRGIGVDQISRKIAD